MAQRLTPRRPGTLLRLIQASPAGQIALYNTRDFQRQHGYPQPHLLKQDLDALKHLGFVVLVGEGFLAATDRHAHTGNWDHNWLPDAVVIVTGEVFRRSVRTALANGWKRRYLNIGSFMNRPDIQWLNTRPDGGGNRPRVTGQYLASLARVMRG